MNFKIEWRNEQAEKSLEYSTFFYFLQFDSKNPGVTVQINKMP